MVAVCVGLLGGTDGQRGVEGNRLRERRQGQHEMLEPHKTAGVRILIEFRRHGQQFADPALAEIADCGEVALLAEHLEQIENGSAARNV